MAKIHTVRQGECLSSIAKNYGFSSWRTIYDHPENADFRKLRPNPNLIYPGDKLYIPDKTKGGDTGGTGQQHKFKLKRSKTFLRIVLLSSSGDPLGDEVYKLEVEGKAYDGTTDGTGLVEQEIPADAEKGRLTIWLKDDAFEQGHSWTLAIGHLDPLEKISGVQARLNNLGYNSGPVDNIQGPITTAAVKAFQAHYDLTVDGIVGPQTRGKLKDVYGC